jgi:dolichol kinase
MFGIFGLLAAIVGVLALLEIGEYIRKTKRYKKELNRKFVHITVACFAASWPFFLGWQQIELMSLLLFVGVLLSRQFKIFRAIHNARDHGWGELFFAMAIGLAAVLSQAKLVFVAAMLHLGLADGMAAVVGVLLAQKQYKVLGNRKTYGGTATFLALSVLIVVFTVVVNGPHMSWTHAIWVPIVATALENLGAGGTDNLLVPLAISVLLY